MVDLRIPERDMHDRAIMRLSTAARHDYWSLCLLAVAMRVDGRLEPDDLAAIPWGVSVKNIPELIRAGLLIERPGGWSIANFVATQTSAAILEHMDVIRAYERDKKRAQRAKAAGVPDDVGPGTRPGHVPGQVPGTPQEGQDRPETEPETEPETGNEADEYDDAFATDPGEKYLTEPDTSTDADSDEYVPLSPAKVRKGGDPRVS